MSFLVFLIFKNSKVSMWYTLFNTSFFGLCFFLSFHLRVYLGDFSTSVRRELPHSFSQLHIRKNFLTIRACLKIELCHWEHSGKEQTGMMELRLCVSEVVRLEYFYCSSN